MSRMDLSLCESRVHYVNEKLMFADIPDGFEQIQILHGQDGPCRDVPYCL